MNERTILGVIIAPLAPLVVIVMFILTDSQSPYALEFGFLMLVATLFSYMGTILIGIPIGYVLRRQSWTGYLAVSFAGILSGAALLFLIASLIQGSFAKTALEEVWTLMLVGGVLGLLVSVVFRIIAGDFSLKATNKSSSRTTS